MSNDQRTFNLGNPLDVEAVREALLTEESDYEGNIDDSETDEEEYVSEREGNSESEQSADSSEDDGDVMTGTECYTAVQKKNNKVTNSWNWRKVPLHRVKRARHNILLHLPGVIGPAKNLTNILEIWTCLFSVNMIQQIVDYTNKYICSIRSNYVRLRDARETDVVEMKALFGLLYLAGVYHGNRLNLLELWKMDDFKQVMNLKRFHFLMRSIRFDDLETREERKKVDRLAPIRDIFEEFVAKCQECYSLGENVTIDEKLEGFRGRCSFVQYMPKKPRKYGIKMYVMVDSRVFYAYNMEIYAGTQPEGPFSISNKPSDVVKRLASPIYGSGRNVTCDNWFSDYELVRELAEKKLSFVGTMKKNKFQIPKELKATKGREPYTSLFCFRKEATLVSYVPKRNKNVILISSLHNNDDAIDPDSKEKQKPTIITFYNQTKGGVDTNDKLSESYNVARNTRRWPLVFFSILNIAAINAFIIFTANTDGKIRRREFLRKLSEHLFEENFQRRANIVTGELREKLKKRTQDASEAEEESGRPAKKRCRLCLKEKRTRVTRYTCEFCKKFICVQHSKYICTDCNS